MYPYVCCLIPEPGHEENPSPLDGELRPDNNANSTYSEPDNREDSPVSDLLSSRICIKRLFWSEFQFVIVPICYQVTCDAVCDTAVNDFLST